ncbi:asparagine synthase (glutamine-hydrolyzing) [Vibrio harveyi]|uniref:asparagine synthase (glutamine-hydrolyzing) n=1 Tax=Vibrio harveyi TaxID=669 RepID=UPI002380B5A5|nr:asparagine synthase (glutamine-hydrolyzing) [Vibrio harveyi]
MCGILGVISRGEISQTEFEGCLKKIDHRGPDDLGSFYDHGIALGQTRLSIIDLSDAGHQPMFSNCGRYVLVYNGEVYNFKELKQDLITNGVSFYSETDSEVILNGFIYYKEKIVEKLNGMFAFAIHDRLENRTFFARDRHGIKPLYYRLKNGEFSFSSEIKSLPNNKKINLKSKILFLLFGYIPEPYTIYDDIFMFPSCSYGYYEQGELRLTCYHQFTYGDKLDKSYEDVLYEVNALLESSIERHLIADAPIGTFLSGGIDSSLLTALASKYKDKLRTLSLTFDDDKFSEEYYQDLIAERYQTQHVKYCITEKEFINAINPFISSLDQPTVDGINTYLVSKAAKASGLTTVLSGLGGDELFYGYPSFKRVNVLNFLRKIPYPIIKVFERSNKYKKMEFLKVENELSFYLPSRALFSPREISEILNIEIGDVFSTIYELWNKYNMSSIKELEDKVSFMERKLYMQGQLLRDSDVFGMAHSLEIRVPFLDNNLVDYITKVKTSYKFGENNKQILADIAKKHLPNDIIERPKMGFVLPFETWFLNNIELFDFNEKMKEKFVNKEIPWSKMWALFILESFEKNEL